jgi:hypothetical protein
MIGNPWVFLRDRPQGSRHAFDADGEPVKFASSVDDPNMRPTALTVRLYDFFVVLAMAIQSCAIGLIVDLIRWVRRRNLAKSSLDA